MNLDEYLKLDNLTPEVIVDSTYITSGISATDTTISVNSTKGFPQKYGLFKLWKWKYIYIWLCF